MKKFAIKNCEIDALILKCPLLKVFICWPNSAVKISFDYDPKNLKYFECLNCYSNIKSTYKFTNLECLNLLKSDAKL